MKKASILLMLIISGCNLSNPKSEKSKQSDSVEAFNKYRFIALEYKRPNIVAINSNTIDTLGIFLVKPIVKELIDDWNFALLFNIDDTSFKLNQNGNYKIKYDSTSDSFWFYLYRDLRKVGVRRNANSRADSFITHIMNEIPKNPYYKHSFSNLKFRSIVIDFYEIYFNNTSRKPPDYSSQKAALMNRIPYYTLYSSESLLPSPEVINNCCMEISFSINPKSYRKHVVDKRKEMYQNLYNEIYKLNSQGESENLMDDTLYLFFLDFNNCNDFIVLKVSLKTVDNQLIIESKELIDMLPLGQGIIVW